MTTTATKASRWDKRTSHYGVLRRRSQWSAPVSAPRKFVIVTRTPRNHTVGNDHQLGRRRRVRRRLRSGGGWLMKRRGTVDRARTVPAPDRARVAAQMSRTAKMRSRNTVWEGTCSGWAGGARANYPRDGRPAVWPTFRRRVRLSSFLSSLRARGRKRRSSRRRTAATTALRAYLPKSFAFRGSCPRQRQLTAAPQHRQNRLYHHHHCRRRIRSFNANTDATEGLLALG